MQGVEKLMSQTQPVRKLDMEAERHTAKQQLHTIQSVPMEQEGTSQVTSINQAAKDAQNTLQTGTCGGSISTRNLNEQKQVAVQMEKQISELSSAIVNLRAEADPQRLSVLVAEVLGDENVAGIPMHREHEETFRPARPVPTHRVSVEESSS